MVMVMETPSPQSVGREFVRQYYTMLNQAPLHLHRFYNASSSFVHGGIDQPGQETDPVYGQQEIHKKIMQLNFRDCHAKIRQVDSHATMGDGVVVQVAGELSNNGQPMRRFMQTFVLAQQSPKRYYVHNDIFRYQDEVFQVDEDDNEVVEGAAESEPEDDHGDVADAAESVSDNATYFDPPTVSNGSAHIEEIAAMSSATIQPVTGPAPRAQASPPPSHVDQNEAEMDKLEPTSDNELMFEEKAPSKSPEPADELMQCPQPPDSPNEPKTYANMVSKNTSSASSGSTGSGSATSWHTAGTSKLPSTPPTPNLPQMNMRMESSKQDGFMSSQNTAQPQRMQQRSRGNSMRGGGLRDRGTTRNSDDAGDGDRRRSTSMFPDNHQLFVGNLPHTITEDELKVQFSKYGNVVDIRINNRSNPKPGTSLRLPNFGFIAFEDSIAVHRALEDKPIMYRDEHRLNIEEKKSKPRDQRIGGGDGRPNSGRGGNIGRVGLGMGRGGNRGGPGGMNRSDNRGGGPGMGNRGGFGQGPRR